MIRISGGRLKGQNIHCPKGKAVRPTTSFVRESMFNILGPRIREARVLDLFAGCGIVGIEALSRGADTVEAVEKSATHCGLLEKNREQLQLSAQQYSITCMDAFSWIQRQTHTPPYDMIYLDPPYTLEGVDKLVSACFEKNLLAPTGILVWESALKVPPNIPGADCVDQRRYGRSTLLFYEVSAPANPDHAC